MPAKNPVPQWQKNWQIAIHVIPDQTRRDRQNRTLWEIMRPSPKQTSTRITADFYGNHGIIGEDEQL